MGVRAFEDFGHEVSVDGGVAPGGSAFEDHLVDGGEYLVHGELEAGGDGVQDGVKF